MSNVLNVNIKRKMFKHSSDFPLKNQKDKVKLTRLTFGTASKAVDYAPYYIAKVMNWFDKLGIEIEHKEFTTITDLVDAISKGKVDMVFGADSALITAQQQGASLKIIGINSSLTQDIIVRKDSKINKVDDLIGKKLAVLKGTSSHFGVLRVLENREIKQEKVRLVNLTPEDAKKQFETKNVDAWAVWPPYIDEQIINGNARILPRGEVYIASMIGVREELFTQNKETILDILGILDNAKKWIKVNESTAQKKISSVLKISIDIVKTSWKRHDFQIDTSNNVVIADLSLDIRPNEFITILGPSGCGKTTLLKIISGLDTDYRGSILFKKKEINKPTKEQGFMFQEHRLLPWLTVRENVQFGIDTKDEKLVLDLLHLVGLEKFVNSYPNQLSGGMAQRVALARALVNIPDLILLDEPFSSLDVITKRSLQNKLLEITKKKKTTALMVTHDIEEAVYLSDKILIMSSRPASIIKSYKIDLPKDRDRQSKEFSNIVSKIHEDLSNELKLI